MEGLKYVDHTYRDFSRYEEEGGQLTKHKKSGNNFPARLHRMLSDPQNFHAVAWMPHGRAWKIIDKERLTSDAIPKYYISKKYTSFSRQLSAWGFKRLHQPGPDHGCYYHECFLRGLPKLTCLIRRLPLNLGRATPFAEGEPNFCKINSDFPMPPPDSFTPEYTSRSRTSSASPFSVNSEEDFSELTHEQSYTPLPFAQESSTYTATPSAMVLGVPVAIPDDVSNRVNSYYRPASGSSYSQDSPFTPSGTWTHDAGQYFCDRNGYYRTGDITYSERYQFYPNGAPAYEDQFSPQYNMYSQEYHPDYRQHTYARCYSGGEDPPVSPLLIAGCLPPPESFSNQSSSREDALGKSKIFEPPEPACILPLTQKGSVEVTKEIFDSPPPNMY